MLTGELKVNTHWGPNKPENHRFLTWNYRILNFQKIARKKNPGRFIKVSSKSSEMKNIWKLHKPWINFTIFRLNGLLHFLKKNTGIEKLKTAEYRRFKKIYSVTLNNENIGRIYQMSSWQFFNEFYSILRKF